MRPARVRLGSLVAVVLGLAFGAEAASSIDAGRAWRDLERIVGFGPRPSGSAALDRTREYIVGELRKVGVRVRTQSFVAPTALGPVRMANLIAEIPGRRAEAILLGGHYDTKYYPNLRFVGANDGGSSTALLLELARSLAGVPREYTVWVAFLDGEEDRDPLFNRAGLHGSRHLVQELARTGELRRLRAAIVVDMIGDRDLDIRQDAGSAPWLNDLLWTAARRLGYGRHFLDDRIAMEDDHVPFLQAGVAATLLIDYTYGRTADGRGFWHTPEDTLDKLSPRSLQVVGDVLLGALPEIEAALRRR
ncbi:MAG TPA: M28 family peptidase [Methylomirabilota bacterium]|jgi:hypothetical protein|nr:M28 family peptidase [Methylomirabilota bacterium]